jgi:hypothetical protein
MLGIAEKGPLSRSDPRKHLIRFAFSCPKKSVYHGQEEVGRGSKHCEYISAPFGNVSDYLISCSGRTKCLKHWETSEVLFWLPLCCHSLSLSLSRQTYEHCTLSLSAYNLMDSSRGRFHTSVAETETAAETGITTSLQQREKSSRFSAAKSP